MNLKSKLGFTIPNSDLKFTCKKTKILDDYLFIISNSSEILTFKKEEDQINNISYYEKKYLILTSMQDREDILDLFIMNSSDHILSNYNIEQVLIIISANFIIYYFNLDDGLCLNKINLSLIKHEQILFTSSILKRFILFIFKRKAMIYDSYSHIIFKEEQMKILNRREEENINDFQYFEIKNIYKIKENCFFLKSVNEETFFLNVEKLNTIDSLILNYEDSRIRIIKLIFELGKFFTEDTQSCIFSKEEFIFYNINNIIKVSFLDSVDELTEISSYTTKVKFPIIYINKLIIKKEENLIVIYKDLSCELFTYDKKLREIKPKMKLMLMVEDEFLNMNYLTSNNVLIGYTSDFFQIFDLRRINNNNEKYVDKIINLKEIFNQEGKKLFFTNYLNATFPSYINDLLNKLSPGVTKKENLPTLNDSNYNIYQENIPFDINSNILNPIKTNYNFNITASLIYFYNENKSIYYIIGTNTGKIAIIDIFFTENLSLNPVIFLDYHKSQIDKLSIYENRLLITSSIDGMVSFTDISKQKIESIIYKTQNNDLINKNDINNIINYMKVSNIKKSLDDNIINQFNLNYIKQLKKISDDKLFENNILLTLIPIYNFKFFCKLKRILPVILLDNDSSSFIPDQQRRKINSLIALIFENNDAIILRMDNFISLYRFNQASTNLNIEAIYHITNEKCFIFYLNNNSIKISSYASRTCDRYISDPNLIYDILRVNEKLSLFFEKSENTIDYVNFIKEENLKYDDSLHEGKNIEQFAKNKTNKNHYIPSNENISVSYIKNYINAPDEKKLFTKKLYQIVMNRRQKLLINYSKEESNFIKLIEMHVIDKIIEIINNNENEILQKIKIMNILYNPQLFTIIYDNHINFNEGIINNYMNFGGQFCQNITINFDNYFSYIEKQVNKQENFIKSTSRINYYNFISLFHIWNFNLDLDYTLYDMYKLLQPIFDFYPILFGIDSTCSIILKEEKRNIYLNINFNEHFNFFKDYITLKNKEKKSNNKSIQQKNLFLDKNMLIENQQGYLVNLKNYQISTNLSHLLHIALFGSLISLLGFHKNKRLCDFIDIEKKIMRTLTIKTQIKFSNLKMFYNFMYENNDNVTSTNKDLLLYDYFQYQCHISLKDKYDINSRMEFKVIMNHIMIYLSEVYKYIFNMDDDNIYINFVNLTKDSNLDFGNKLKFLSKYELSLITFLILYNYISINSNINEKLPDIIIQKVTHLLIIAVFKIIKEKKFKFAFSRNIADLLGKLKDVLELIYKEKINNYALFLIQYYTIINIPINLDSPFIKFEIGNYSILKNEEKELFLKLILAKLLLQFAKTKLSSIIKVIMDEFQKNKHTDFTYCSYLIEIIYIIFQEKSFRLTTFLPPIINLIMKTMNPNSKDLKNICIENSKKVLSKLLMNYPMVTFHQESYKLAIGTNEGKILIYDMSNGELWKNISGYKNEISALSFDISGNIIISYCANEGLVKCYKLGVTNFFSSILSNKEYRQYKYDIININNKDDIVDNVSLECVKKKDNEIFLRRENNSIQMIKL